jgi:hypothetical protein
VARRTEAIVITVQGQTNTRSANVLITTRADVIVLCVVLLALLALGHTLLASEVRKTIFTDTILAGFLAALSALVKCYRWHPTTGLCVLLNDLERTQADGTLFTLLARYHQLFIVGAIHIARPAPITAIHGTGTAFDLHSVAFGTGGTRVPIARTRDTRG